MTRRRTTQRQITNETCNEKNNKKQFKPIVQLQGMIFDGGGHSKRNNKQQYQIQRKRQRPRKCMIWDGGGSKNQKRNEKGNNKNNETKQQKSENSKRN